MTVPQHGTPGDDVDGIDRREIFARHQRWLRTVVFARTGSRDAVDEIVQEIALAFFRSDSRPSKLDGIAPWLYRVAIRQTLLYRRRAGRQRRLQQRFVQDVPPQEHDGRSDPLDWLLAGERRDVVRAAVQRLATKDAEILLLKYTEDWSYRDLAEHLGASVSAVEARLHRARGRLRAELERMIDVPTENRNGN
jgi:RNA polymerase sigma factor (sigma-70 family)